MSSNNNNSNPRRTVVPETPDDLLSPSPSAAPPRRRFAVPRSDVEQRRATTALSSSSSSSDDDGFADQQQQTRRPPVVAATISRSRAKPPAAKKRAVQQPQQPEAARPLPVSSVLSDSSSDDDDDDVARAGRGAELLPTRIDVPEIRRRVLEQRDVAYADQMRVPYQQRLPRGDVDQLLAWERTRSERAGKFWEVALYRWLIHVGSYANTKTSQLIRVTGGAGISVGRQTAHVSGRFDIGGAPETPQSAFHSPRRSTASNDDDYYSDDDDDYSTTEDDDDDDGAAATTSTARALPRSDTATAIAAGVSEALQQSTALRRRRERPCDTDVCVPPRLEAMEHAHHHWISVPSTLGTLEIDPSVVAHGDEALLIIRGRVPALRNVSVDALINNDDTLVLFARLTACLMARSGQITPTRGMLDQTHARTNVIMNQVLQALRHYASGAGVVYRTGDTMGDTAYSQSSSSSTSPQLRLINSSWGGGSNAGVSAGGWIVPIN
jgi:hypothetical protein